MAERVKGGGRERRRRRATQCGDVRCGADSTGETSFQRRHGARLSAVWCSVVWCGVVRCAVRRRAVRCGIVRRSPVGCALAVRRCVVRRAAGREGHSLVRCGALRCRAQTYAASPRRLLLLLVPALRSSCSPLLAGVFRRLPPPFHLPLLSRPPCPYPSLGVDTPVLGPRGAAAPHGRPKRTAAQPEEEADRQV